MKPLFGIDLTEKNNDFQINGAEFIAATASEENNLKHDRYQILAKYLQRNAKLPRAFGVIKKVVSIIATLVAIYSIRALVDSDGPHLKQSFEKAPVLFYIGGACLVLWGILILAERIKRKKVLSSPVAKQLKNYPEIENAILHELGVPEGTNPTDVFVFGYTLENGEPVPKVSDTTGIAFRNVRMAAYSDGANLYLADALRRHEIPLSSMRRIRTVNERIALPKWKKEESFVSPTYKPYDIYRNKHGVIFVKPYHILEFEHNGEIWGLYFPCYELPTFESLTLMKAEKVSSEEI